MTRGLYTLCCWVVGPLWSVLCISAALVVRLFDWRERLVPWMTRVLWAGGVLRSIGVRLDVRGLENVPAGQGALLVSNHQGNFDILAILAACPGKTVLVSKRENFWIPFLGWHMKLNGYISVDRKNRMAAVRSLEQVKHAVQRGWRVAIFAEGTRWSDGFIHPFKKGAFAIALEGQLPIVPLALDGSHRVMAKGSIAVRPGTIRLAFGKPIATTGMTPDDRTALLKRVRAEIAALHQSIGGAGEAPGEPEVAAAKVA